MSAEALLAIMFGLSGAVIGGWGLVEARKARAEARKANHHADEANRLSEQANQISERALELSERLGRDQIELQRQEVALAHQAERRLSANIFQVSPAMKNSHGEFNLRLENRGPHHADRVSVFLHQNDQVLNVGHPTDLAPGKFTEFSGHRGNFFAGALENELDDLELAPIGRAFAVTAYITPPSPEAPSGRSQIWPAPIGASSYYAVKRKPWKSR